MQHLNYWKKLDDLKKTISRNQNQTGDFGYQKLFLVSLTKKVEKRFKDYSFVKFIKEQICITESIR